MDKCKIGLMGLAVMGQNLVLNMAGKGFSTAVFNRTVETAERFMTERVAGLPVWLGRSMAEFVELLEKPRTVMLMVKAGEAVDQALSLLTPLMEPGDLVMDLGNSHYKDTERRGRELIERGIEFMGVGVSGGEEGALNGPSIMPGGSPESYERVRPVLEAIAARTDDGPCVTHVGPGGAGHFVKMVHNGLEYGDMQLIAECHDILARLGGLDQEAEARAFERYNQGELGSYLIEITIRVLRERDPESGGPLLPLILDKAGQKGTGTWTAQAALELGEPCPTITAAVEARGVSSKKEERTAMAGLIPGPGPAPGFEGDLVEAAGAALLASKLSLYAQGTSLLSKASAEYGWGLDIAELARIWKGGCIIRAKSLALLSRAFSNKPWPMSLLAWPEVMELLSRDQENWRKTTAAAIGAGAPCPALSASLAYFDGCRSERLPADLIQAQRDLFGAHGFERIDRPGAFHHHWRTPGKKN